MVCWLPRKCPRPRGYPRDRQSPPVRVSLGRRGKPCRLASCSGPQAHGIADLTRESMIGTVAACVFLVTLLLVRDQQQAIILVAAFAFRIALSIVHLAVFPLPDSQFDARTFEHVAWLWARDGRFFDDFTTGSYLYSWLSSGIYLIFGRDPFLLHVINSYYGTLAIYFVMRSGQLLLPRTRLDRAVGWALAFYPSVVLYSVLTMREAPMVLTLSISIYLLLSWVTTRRIVSGLGAVAFVIVAQLFHAGMIGATLAVLLIYSRFSLQSITVRDNLRPVALFGLIAATIGVLQFSLRTGVGLEKVWSLLREFDIETITGWQSYSARGRGAYLTTVEMNGWLDLVWNIPLRILFFLGTPFIWMASQFRDFLGLLDALILLYMALRITLDIRQRRLLTIGTYLSVALVVAAIVSVFALGTSNYGTAFRHRAKVFPWLLLLYLYGTSIRCPRSSRALYHLSWSRKNGRDDRVCSRP